MGVLDTVLRALAAEGPWAESTIQRLIGRLSGADDATKFLKNADQVGEAYFGAAQANPQLFEKGRQFGRSTEELAKQFGVEAPVMNAGDDISRAFWGDRSWGARGSVRERGPSFFNNGLDEYHNDLMSVNPEKLEEMRAAGWDLNRINQLRHYDTTSLNKNTGAGTKLYAAAYGDLANKPGEVNFADTLTQLNGIRRNYNQSAAILREPRLLDQILTHKTQVQGVPMSATMLHRGSPQRAVGALQLAGHERTLTKLDSAMRDTQNMLRRDPEGYQHYAEPMLKLSRAINQLDEVGGQDLTALKGLALAIRGSPVPGLPPIGPKTTRRMSLAFRALDGEDIPRDLTTHLEYADGGVVHSVGNLRRRAKRSRV